MHFAHGFRPPPLHYDDAVLPEETPQISTCSNVESQPEHSPVKGHIPAHQLAFPSRAVASGFVAWTLWHTVVDNNEITTKTIAHIEKKIY